MTYLIEGVTLIDPEEMSIIRHSFAVVKTTTIRKRHVCIRIKRIS